MKPYDTIVIGAGVAGLSVARELAKRKQRVLVVEQEEIGGSASRAAAGILDPYTEAKEETPLFRLGVKALEFYPSFLQELGEKTPARVEYEKAGVLYLGLSAEDEDLLKDRFEWQKKRRLPVESVSLDKVRKMEPALSPLVRNGIFYPEIPKLNADKLTQALLEEARSEGVELKTSVGGSSVWTEGKKVRGVKTSQESFESRSVVAASGPWAGLDPNLGIGKSVKSVRGQILILRTNASFQPTHILHTIHYAYIVPWPGNRILVGSTLETHAGFDCRVTPEGKEDPQAGRRNLCGYPFPGRGKNLGGFEALCGNRRSPHRAFADRGTFFGAGLLPERHSHQPSRGPASGRGHCHRNFFTVTGTLLPSIGGFKMKMRIAIFVSLWLGLSFSQASALETPKAEPAKSFSTQGTLTRVDLPANVIYLKNEGGLELTFHLSETTEIRSGEKTRSAADLAAAEEVEIDYEYNADYEKMAHSISIKKSPPPASFEKKPAPST